MTSSPFRPGASVEDQLAYYKAQYEQLEVELHEFQASSKDLEAELEKDVEESEKRERKLKEQVESLGFEVDEWKTKSKQSRDEANRAQTVLQKEITTMRESNRSLQLKLRDIEVANDDYERQARNTTSSLEDLESKYNVAIERGVMFEEEIRSGEKEREELRIETQRLRDELSDLRVEFEITQEKLHRTEAALERSHSRKMPLYANPARPRSPSSETSAITPTSPSVSTPPASKSESSGNDVPTPPSPPLSDTAGPVRKAMPKTPVPAVRRSLMPGDNTTPRPSKLATRVPRHSRGPSLSAGFTPAATTSSRMGPPRPRPAAGQSEGVPRSGSLYQIKGLIGRMQKIEERVHSVRSKLPPPSASKGSTPRNSPRTNAIRNSPQATVPAEDMPSSVTLRSSRKRPSNVSSFSQRNLELEQIDRPKRLSFGMPSTMEERPTSRPSSRASNVSNSEANPFVRPSSRLSMGGARTPLGSFLPSRPRSSIGGNYSSVHGVRHGASSSISESRTETESNLSTPTGRRTTLDKSAIPTPSSRRQSGGLNNPAVGRRASQTFALSQKDGSMAPPLERPRKASGLGETF
ncbi:NUDE protein [Elsinoe ampelina]|uniref:NUDE protein n=1 Tax=Elsinoe ampelina TaxID=302913 RepID=A0A6A6G7P7_9PEZI|nr:NUDE protein [Elsinoe ampelina]